MNVLKFEILINGTWEVLDPVFNDFKIKRVRDKHQIFVVKTVSSGDLKFSCNDYNLLIPFVGQTIEGRLTETICGNENIYDIDFILSDSYDFYLKTITAKTVIKDDYWKLNNEVNTLAFNEDKEKVLTFKVLAFQNSDKISGFYTVAIQDILNYYINAVSDFLTLDETKLNELLTFFDITNIVFSVEKGFISYVSNDLCYNPSQSCGNIDDVYHYITFSLSKLLLFIRDNLFTGYYIEDNKIKLEWLSADVWLNGLDLISNEDINDKKILFTKENEQNIIKFKTFEFLFEKMDAISQKYCNTNVVFNDKKNAEIKNIIDFTSDILQVKNEKDLKYIFDVKTVNNEINLGDYSEQFWNDPDDPFYFADGDFDELKLQNNSLQSYIWFPSLKGFQGFETVTVEFDASGIVGTTDWLVVCQYSHYIQNGANSLTFNLSGSTSNIREIYIYTQKLYQITISNVVVKLKDFSDYYNIADSIVEGVSIPSGATTPRYLVENFGAEMNSNIATIDGVDYSVEESNKFQQQISFNHKNTIDTLNEFELVQTSLGWLRVDEMERKYSNNHFSDLYLTLTGK